MMHGRGKSSPVIVAGKPANNADPDSVSAAESVERRAGAEGNANQHARTGLRAGHAWSWLASIRQAARLDCQYPRREPYAGKLQVRFCAGGARQLASLPRLCGAISVRPNQRVVNLDRVSVYFRLPSASSGNPAIFCRQCAVSRNAFCPDCIVCRPGSGKHPWKKSCSSV
jgi:hypothetical protein